MEKFEKCLDSCDSKGYRWIVEEAEAHMAKVEKALKDAKDSIMMDKCCYFDENEAVDIAGHRFFGTLSIYKSTYAMDSQILPSRQIGKLLKLCQFAETSNFQCIYRGSWDGHEPTDFHRKCDGVSPTLTIIKTDKSYIFGGFTEVPWESIAANRYEIWKFDEMAFIFSLVNKDNLPIKMKCTRPECAIYSCVNNGPTFGWDIIVYNSEGQSFLGYSYKHSKHSFDSKDAKEFLAGGDKFHIQNIEVFKMSEK